MSDPIEDLLATARACHLAQDFAGAEVALRDVIAKKPKDPHPHGMLGLALFEQRRNSAAQAALETAVQLRPDRADYHHNLGVVLAVRGAVSHAEGHMREAIRLKPDYAEAFYNLSALIKLRHADPLTDQIEALLARGEMGKDDRCFLHFAAGKLYDDLKETDRAFAHYQRANAAKGVRYDKAAREAEVRQARRVFTKAFLAERNTEALKTGGRVVFIVGMPRSGTSLTEQILTCHSTVYGAGELPDIRAIATALSEHAGGANYPESAALVAPDVLRGLGRHYVKRLVDMAGDAPVVINKMPLDFQHLGLICAMFADPVILHCRRDPLDTCLSNYFQNFKPGHDFSFSLDGVGHFYRMYHSMMVHWAEVLPVPIIDVSYEALVKNPQGESRRILGEMELDWEDACAAPHLNARSVKTASYWQVRQPVYKTATRRWKAYAAHLGPLKAALERKA